MAATAGLALFIYGIYYSVVAATSPWWLPYGVLEGEQPIGTAERIRFADYPYASGATGFILRPPVVVYDSDGVPRSGDTDSVTPRKLQSVAAQVGLESGMGVRDGILRFGLRARVQFPLRLQLESDWSMFREHDREGVDRVFMGRELLSVRFAESPRVQFYSGAGAQHFCDRLGCEHGVDVTWGFEAFPHRPVVFGFEGSIGNLGHAFAPGIRARIGVLVGPVEASLGWYQRWVGDVPLGGPYLGLTGWF